jgi:hypothetical protein
VRETNRSPPYGADQDSVESVAGIVDGVRDKVSADITTVFVDTLLEGFFWRTSRLRHCFLQLPKYQLPD